MTPEEMQAEIAALKAKLAESEAARAAQATAMEDMQKKMDAGEIAAAGPDIEAVAADIGVAKAADAAATLDALTAHLKMSAKGKDALSTIRVLAAAKARDAKPGRQTFDTPPAKSDPKTTDANPNTDAGADLVKGRM